MKSKSTKKSTDYHYGWVETMLSDYRRAYLGYEDEGTVELELARIKNLIVTHAPSPDQITPREGELIREVERLNRENDSLLKKLINARKK